MISEGDSDRQGAGGPRVFALVLVIGIVGGCYTAPVPPPPPNFLLVTVDTLRADVLGSYGHRAGASPNIDRLAAQGTRFDRAYTVTPLTIPAHSSLFTGLYPPRHGVRDNGDAFLGPEAYTLAERLKQHGYATGAAVGAEVTSHHWGFAQGFDTYRDELGATAGGNRWAVERPANTVVDDALAILDERSTQGPWMQWVHVFDVHHPYTPPEPHLSQMSGRAYLGEVAWTDAQLGRLFDAVLARPDADRTWIVVLADHGEGLGAHGENTHGVLLYDPTTRIPLIVRPPGGHASLVVDTPTSIVDIVPTLMALAGVKSDESLDGMDLSGQMRGEPAPERSIYIESRYAHHHYGWAPLSALVNPQHKLIHGGRDHLFAATDLGEANDLSGDPARLGQIRGDLDALSA
ncbi:MAG: arylsulfatase A-like enzyme, partial [Kiritimatiellia bacterium]